MIQHTQVPRLVTWSDRRSFPCPRSDYRSPHCVRFYAGDSDCPRLPWFLDIPVSIVVCEGCNRRSFGQLIMEEGNCLTCGGQLQIVGSWDLTRVAWPWLE